MVITGRVPLLLLLGLVSVVLRPAMSTVWLWLLLVVLVTALDWFWAVKPSTLTLRRAPIGSVRLGYDAESRLTVGNGGTRAVSAVLRDAWQPTAGAEGNREQKLQAYREVCDSLLLRIRKRFSRVSAASG